MRPTVELIYFTGCRHVERTRAALREALVSHGLPARWEEWDQFSPTAPERVHGYASPTVLVGGRDVTGVERTTAAFACRSAGGPSARVIQAALVALGPGAVDEHRLEVDHRRAVDGLDRPDTQPGSGDLSHGHPV